MQTVLALPVFTSCFPRANTTMNHLHTRFHEPRLYQRKLAQSCKNISNGLAESETASVEVSTAVTPYYRVLASKLELSLPIDEDVMMPGIPRPIAVDT